MEKYKPVPEKQRQAGEHWRIISDGQKVHNGRREIILEYMGAQSSKFPRYLTFKFYNYLFTGVVEKYFGVDPKVQLEQVMGKYGMYNSQDLWKGRERYIWDDGQVQILFPANLSGKAALFSFQLKMFASELR